MIWTHHHIYLTVSRQILVGEFLQAYELLVAAGPAEWRRTGMRTIRHIEGGDKERRSCTGGIPEGSDGSLLPFIRPGRSGTRAGGIRGRGLILDQELTGR